MSDLLDFSPPGQVTFTLAGAKARFYDAGTTTLRTVYADQAETVPHPSPLLADSNGRFPQAFVSGNPVKAVITQADDSTGYTLDPCEKVAATGAGASSISFSPTGSIPATNVQAAIELAAASAAAGFDVFGLGITGNAPLLANIDATATATGQYRFDNTTTGTYPTGVSASDTGAIAFVRETAGSAWEWLYHDTTDRLFVRRMSGSVWGAWRENITANIGATEGDLLYRTSTAWTRLAKGTAAQQLRMNAGATAPEWFTPSTPAPTSKTLLGTITTTSGTTQSLTSLALTGYTSLECIINGVSSTGTTGTLRLGNTGGLQISSVLGIGSETWSGQVNIDLATGVATSVVVTSAGSPVSYAAAGASGLSTASTSISFSLSASNNFDAGSIRVYGVP